MSLASYGVSDKCHQKTWLGRHSNVSNKSLPIQSNPWHPVCRPILTDFKTWERVVLILFHAVLKTGEGKNWNHREKTHTTHTHTHPYTQSNKLLTFQQGDELNERRGHKAIGTNSPKIVNSDRIILLSHYACQSSPPNTYVPPLCQTLSNRWELKGWTRDPALKDCIV